MSKNTIKIEKIIGDGRGIGRLDNGKVVMIPFVLPGEEVLFRTLKRHKDYIEAVPLEIIDASEYRVEPICKYFEKCGGCDFQHTGYEHQISLKEDSILEQMSRIVKAGDHDLENIWEGITSSPRRFGYRQRIRLHVNDNGETGFFRSGSNIVQRISNCPLAREEINELLIKWGEIGQARSLLQISNQVEILSSIGDSMLMLIFHLKCKPRSAVIEAARGLISEFPRIKNIVLEGVGFQRRILFCEGTDRDAHIILPFDINKQIKLDPYTLVLEPGGFSQVNHELNQLMIATLIKWAKETAAEKVLDMYCGMGNLSIPLAMSGYQVSGFDLQRSAIRSAKKNSDQYDLKCDFFRASSRDGLTMYSEKDTCDLLVIDPPRKGCRESINDIVKSDCKSIIYVSCEPATLCRDLNQFIDEGFCLIKAKGFDMFPQTHHLETMILLARNIT